MQSIHITSSFNQSIVHVIPLTLINYFLFLHASIHIISFILFSNYKIKPCCYVVTQVNQVQVEYLNEFAYKFLSIIFNNENHIAVI